MGDTTEYQEQLSKLSELLNSSSSEDSSEHEEFKDLLSKIPSDVVRYQLLFLKHHLEDFVQSC